jgi:hypothetical protein
MNDLQIKMLYNLNLNLSVPVHKIRWKKYFKMVFDFKYKYLQKNIQILYAGNFFQSI